MRTNIDIDDATLESAMKAGPFKTKKDAVEAGLKLLVRQAAYREILKWEGKLRWDGDAWADERSDVAPTTGAHRGRAVLVSEAATNVTAAPTPRKGRAGVKSGIAHRSAHPSVPPSTAKSAITKPRHGRR